jgi:hypothetical protein
VPVVLVLLLVSGSYQKISYGLDTPQPIYPGCFCFYEWNDANRVGDWIFEENWLQLEEPDAVAFVRISGDNTITLTKARQVNQLTVGENRWDTTRLVLEEDLTIGMWASYLLLIASTTCLSLSLCLFLSVFRCKLVLNSSCSHLHFPGSKLCSV